MKGLPLTLSGSWSLGAAKFWLLEHREEGVTCPCCGQLAKVYRRTIHASMGRGLITMARAGAYEWHYLPSLLPDKRSADNSKLAHWGLIEPRPDERRDDGSHRNGWWRLTNLGVEFAYGNAYVRKYARIYNGKLLGLDGDSVGIRDVLGKQFNYADLMAGV